MTAEVNVSLVISFENLFQSTTRKLIKHNQKLWIASSGSNETHERFTWNDINKSYMLNLKRGWTPPRFIVQIDGNINFNRRVYKFKLIRTELVRLVNKNMIKGYSLSQRGSHPKFNLKWWVNVENKTNSLRKVTLRYNNL
ncbi:MAG: hypothetical protein ACTS4W_01085 [Candidatus Hodgkinia cicadicola]